MSRRTFFTKNQAQTLLKNSLGRHFALQQMGLWKLENGYIIPHICLSLLQGNLLWYPLRFSECILVLQREFYFCVVL